uniref:Odorant-binding protein n=1 Tax=Bactrocera correcta TaxID=47773 RepID=A0A6M9TYA7_BACCC|nr:odorant-binding protein [Bactrocera correcta]
MKAYFGYFVVIFVFVCHASADDETVDCTKPPRFVPPHMCCPVPDVSTDELKKQCAEYNKPPPPPPMGRGGPPKFDRPHHMHHPPPCVIDCIFNNTEVMGANGEPDVDKFSALLDTAVQDNEEMAAVMEESFETCVGMLSELKAKMAEKASKHPEFAGRMGNCSPVSGMLMMCVNMETFKNCPASAWNDSTECNAARNFFKQCKFPKDGN